LVDYLGSSNSVNVDNFWSDADGGTLLDVNVTQGKRVFKGAAAGEWLLAEAKDQRGGDQGHKRDQ